MSLTLSPHGAAGHSDPAVAPAAPGRLGVPITAAEAFTYLTALGQWRDVRKHDLDAVDAAALAAPDPTAFTADLVVSLALWKAIADRYELLEVTFDSGRVGATQAERLSALIWGRLDVNPGGAAPGSSGAAGALGSAGAVSGSLAITLPEACRLCDAMVSALRARLSLEPSQAEVGTRLAVVRTGVERVRDQIGLVPPGPDRESARDRLTRLEQRVLDVTDRAKRGADVGGLLGPLEVDTASIERDLIVASAERLEAAHDREHAVTLRADLDARAEAIRALEQQCLRLVNPAPVLAIPRVSALGEVPTEPEAVASYLTRLAAVGRALDRAHAAYADALSARAEVLGLAGALTAQAQATSLTPSARADLDAIGALVRAATEQVPTDLARARALVDAFQSYLTSSTRKAPR